MFFLAREFGFGSSGSGLGLRVRFLALDVNCKSSEPFQVLMSVIINEFLDYKPASKKPLTHQGLWGEGLARYTSNRVNSLSPLHTLGQKCFSHICAPTNYVRELSSSAPLYTPYVRTQALNPKENIHGKCPRRISQYRAC